MLLQKRGGVMSNNAIKTVLRSCKVTLYIQALVVFFMLPTAIYASQLSYTPVSFAQYNKFLCGDKEHILFPSIQINSNYVWRGVSQSDNDINGQFGIAAFSKYFYAGVWNSTVNFPGMDGKDIRIELQPYVGHINKILEIMYDVGLTRYIYAKGVGPDFTELHVRLNYGPAIIGVARSNNVPSLIGRGTYNGAYYFADYFQKIPNHSDYIYFNDIYLKMHVGAYQFSEQNWRDRNYKDYLVGLTKQHRNFSYSINWSNTINGQYLGRLGGSKVFIELATEI